MLALLSASAFEPLIARNLVDTTRALYLADAGIEWARSLVVVTADGDLLLRDPVGHILGDTEMSLVPAPGLLPGGATTITARRAPDARIVITSTGTVNGAQRTIEVAMTPPPRQSDQPALGGPQGLVHWRER